MSLTLDLSAWVEKAKGNAELVVRKSSLGVISAVIKRSPVGNPELWAANKTATEYNLEVFRYNDALRQDPLNLTKSGRLKKGIKVNDSMDLTSGKGYVGGRFRGNWQVGIGTRPTGTLPDIDPQGNNTIGKAAAVIETYTTDANTIWAVNNLPYGYRLEYEGWSTQAPSGMVRISVAEWQMIVNQAVSELPR
ncbi:MAG: hypothetical protein CMK71_02520 [Pseudomonadaceae bacterium]|nr:hypothetical protein [Pseudomonadaceae bacterium]